MNPSQNGHSENGHGEFVPTRELVRQIHTMMKGMEKRADRVDMILFGDKDAEVDGVVHTVKKHSKYIATDKRLKWIGAGTMAAGGASMGFWDKIHHLIFK